MEDLDDIFEVDAVTSNQFILQSKPVDRFTTIRRRIPLTPSMCTVNGCSFDIATKNGYVDGWSSVPQDQRGLLLQALQEHVKFVHTNSQAHIVEESELPTRWLGGSKKV
jgi:hypothetical protein